MTERLQPIPVQNPDILTNDTCFVLPKDVIYEEDVREPLNIFWGKLLDLYDEFNADTESDFVGSAQENLTLQQRESLQAIEYILELLENSLQNESTTSSVIDLSNNDSIIDPKVYSNIVETLLIRLNFLKTFNETELENLNIDLGYKHFYSQRDYTLRTATVLSPQDYLAKNKFHPGEAVTIDYEQAQAFGINQRLMKLASRDCDLGYGYVEINFREINTFKIHLPSKSSHDL